MPNLANRFRSHLDLDRIAAECAQDSRADGVALPFRHALDVDDGDGPVNVMVLDHDGDPDPGLRDRVQFRFEGPADGILTQCRLIDLANRRNRHLIEDDDLRNRSRRFGGVRCGPFFNSSGVAAACGFNVT